ATALYFLLFRPGIRKMREDEAEKERLAREAAQDRQEVERLRAALEDRLAGVEEEATAIVARAKEQAEVERTALMQETEAEAERILAEAHANADRLGSQTIDEFQDDLLDTILAISGQVIGQVTPPEVHDALIQQLSDRIWEMGRSEMRQVENLRRALGDREPTVYVTTAHSLTSEQQGLLARTFTALADRHVNLEVTTDPTLAAGVRVRLGDMVVDNSIADRLGTLRESAGQTLKGQLTGE
ncbi:MAG: F0F1 ATP synthase subunit delta, partial [Anaerolineae bacterium]|nr:F0F1 ATP synthase subunit delta [Anaerolineae bacterium]